MKRSKISIGSNTAVLAVAGVTTAKRYSSTTRFRVTLGGNWCTAVVTPRVQASNELDICTMIATLSPTEMEHLAPYTKVPGLYIAVWSINLNYTKPVLYFSEKYSRKNTGFKLSITYKNKCRPM